MAKPELQPHILVVGHGRSGTNMVLDLFDCHRTTFCRNEPNELFGTACTGLGEPMFGDDAPQDFTAHWHLALAQTFRSSGARDRFGTDKTYFRSALHAHLGQAVMARRRLRALVLPRQDSGPSEEWLCPASYYNPTALVRALPVLKLLLTPEWVVRTHRAETTQRVVHVLRSPQGFAQSWWGRYVTGIGGGPEKVFADNQPSLARILSHFDRADEMPQSYSLSGLVTSELWRWRYLNEVMIRHLSGSPRYLTVPYEGVMRDKTSWAEKIYDFAGLAMDPTCRARVKAMENTLFSARKPDGIDPTLVEDAVAQVLAGSPCKDLLLGVYT